MTRIEGEITIHRPVEEVFDFVADERNEPRYNPRMLDVRLISPAPIGTGTRFHAEFKKVRGTLPMTIEFTGFERPRRLESAARSSMVDTVGSLTFEPAPDGTRMQWSWEVQPRSFLRLMPSLVAVIGRRQERSIWGSLKRLLESDVGDAVDPANVLVAYASAHGSTKGIAERIAARLDERGARVDLRPIGGVDRVDAYDAVILGSAVYGQRWIEGANEFLRRNTDPLATRRVWLFSVGSFGDTHRILGRLMRKEPKGIDEIQRAIHPRDYRVFAGAIERHDWPLVSRLFFHAFGGRLGDNRDWPEIDAWAESIAHTLDAARADPPLVGAQQA